MLPTLSATLHTLICLLFVAVVASCISEKCTDIFLLHTRHVFQFLLCPPLPSAALRHKKCVEKQTKATCLCYVGVAVYRPLLCYRAATVVAVCARLFHEHLVSCTVDFSWWTSHILHLHLSRMPYCIETHSPTAAYNRVLCFSISGMQIYDHRVKHEKRHTVSIRICVVARGARVELRFSPWTYSFPRMRLNIFCLGEKEKNVYGGNSSLLVSQPAGEHSATTREQHDVECVRNGDVVK